MNNYIKKILSIGFAGTLAASVVPFNVFASVPKLCGGDIPHNKRCALQQCGDDIPHNKRRCVLLQRCVVCGERPERIVEVQNIRGEISYVCLNCFNEEDYLNDFIKCGSVNCDSFISVQEYNLNDGYCDDCARRLGVYHRHNDSDFEERDEDDNINHNYPDPFHREINNIPERVVYPTRVACPGSGDTEDAEDSCGCKPDNVLLAYYDACGEDDEGNELCYCSEGQICCYDCAYDCGVMIPCAYPGCGDYITMGDYFKSRGYCREHADDQQRLEREIQYDNGELNAEYEAFRERADGVVYKKVKNNIEAINEAVRAKGSSYIVNRQAIHNALFPDD